jgi:hypothetical protein
MPSKRKLLAILLLLTIPGTWGSCVTPVSLEGRPCPCAPGWQCCPGDNLCIPQDQACASPKGCSLACSPGTFCFRMDASAEEQCFGCDNNKKCGLGCEDCTRLERDWACTEGACGCRKDADCPVFERCRDGKCAPLLMAIPNPKCTNNKRCGEACVDCTVQGSDWACVGSSSCGCLDNSDCLPSQTCQSSVCAPRP